MKKSNDQSITKLANAAFKQAAMKVIERAKQTGTPVIVWQDESVKEVSPRDALKSLKRERGSSADV